MKPIDMRIRQRIRLPPLIPIRAIETFLLRHSSASPGGPLPEQRLCVAVICQAIADLRGPSDARWQARRFLLGDGLRLWTDLVDLNPEFVRDVAVKTRYLLQITKGAAASDQPPHNSTERTNDAGLQ